MISCLDAPTHHLLMPRDPFQLSSVVTSQYSKKNWKKFLENPLSHSPKVCLYGLRDRPLDLLKLKTFFPPTLAHTLKSVDYDSQNCFTQIDLSTHENSIFEISIKFRY